MSFFRSEEMALCQLYLQSDSAYDCIAELGELGLVQFRDLNPNVNAFQRNFTIEIRRCNEIERDLRFLEQEIRESNIITYDAEEKLDAPRPREIIDIEATLDHLEREVRHININLQALMRNYLDLTELKFVLRKTQAFFEEADSNSSQIADPSRDEERITLLVSEHQQDLHPTQLNFVTGVIESRYLFGFQRMIWRISKGNVYLRFSDIETPVHDPPSGELVRKTVFIVFFQGENLKNKIMKICQGYRGTLYPCPENATDRRGMSIEIMTRIEDLSTIISQTQDHKYRVLGATAKNIKNWFVQITKMKAIYHILNQCSLDITRKCLVAECWAPVAQLETIKSALKLGANRKGSTVPPILTRINTKEEPPTYNYTNKYTKGFQNLIDSYGIASYREVSPTPYTIITFPFLFAIMFGDVGHGFIMLLFAIWMVIKEKKILKKKDKNEVFNIFFTGRYILILMALYSMYTGIIYNDIFSKSFNIFGSHWKAQYTKEELMPMKTATLNPAIHYNKVPYPIGLDPVWNIAENKIIFQNSYKMKISIIFGILQMLFGVCLSLWNHIFFEKPVNIICEFIPQLIFLSFLFLYMVSLMFIKWILYFPTDDISLIKYSPQCAPSILITFINMVLFKESPVPEKCDDYMFSGQKILQKVLIISALICVPWMLLIKPIYLLREQRKQRNTQEQIPTVQKTNTGQPLHSSSPAGDSSNINSTSTANTTEEDDDCMEIFIHQGIHTIEYVLGSISHTASYLRLWALSLAHAQLSEVLWNMVLRIGFRYHGIPGGIVLYFIFSAWAVLTIAILVMMEALSAFLHCLRLHWVEFQSKFYSALGYMFEPFSFKTIIESNL